MKIRHYLISMTCLFVYSFAILSLFGLGTKTFSSAFQFGIGSKTSSSAFQLIPSKHEAAKQKPRKVGNTRKPTINWIEKEIQMIKSETINIDTQVLRLGLKAYTKARKFGLAQKELLTVIDYSQPSTKKRLWVFDLKNGKALFNTWVSHGKNSGYIQANSFSNQPGSLKSSIGVFLTDIPYMGKNGYSLHIRGLEPGVNDNAYSRAIVMHGAHYVTSDMANHQGRLGRSWGCPAVSLNLIKPIINTVKGKSVIFAYYPDKNWLKKSRFLSS